MKENSNQIKYEGMVLIYEKMGKNIKGIESKIKCMVKEYYNGQMEENTMANI